MSVISLAKSSLFQSTPSVGRATNDIAENWVEIDISIHALRGEGDNVVGCYKIFGNVFQSTPSVGRATKARKYIHISS